jgi:hypothetical protein
MRRSWSSVLRFVPILPAVLTAACSGGGGAGAAGSAIMPAAAPIQPPNVDNATLGSNSPVLEAGNTTIASMQVGTVLPLRQSIVSTQINSVSPAPKVEAGGSTLTYQGTQTVNGVTGPVFELKVPNAVSGIDVSLKPDGSSGSNGDYGIINGKVVDALNYTMTVAWSADASDTFEPLFSMGITGFQTPASNVPTSGQATYLGDGTAGAKGSMQGLIFTGPPFPYHPPGTISGSANSFSVNFGSGQVTGTLSGLTATPVSQAGVAGAPQAWNQINISATLSGAVLSGNTSTTAPPSGGLGFGAGSTGKFDGALYGPNGEELGAVWSLRDPATSNTAFGVVAATKQ